MKKIIFSITILFLSCSVSNAWDNISGEGMFFIRPMIDGGGYYTEYGAMRGGISPEVVDGLDEYDAEITYDNFYKYLKWHWAYAYSVIPGGHLLLEDCRPVDNSVDIYNIELAFYGEPYLGSSVIRCGLPYITESGKLPFEDYDIYLASDNFAFGRIILLNNFKGIPRFTIKMKNVEFRDYIYEKYAHLTLYIGREWWKPFPMGDFNRDGIVDLGDYSLIANDWQKPQGSYVADITGDPNGFPDGFVDIADLVECSQWWLCNSMDFNGDSKVNLVDYAILAENWGKSGTGDYTGKNSFPDGKVDGRDLAVFAKQWQR